MNKCYSIHWCIFISHDRISMRALKRGQKSRCNEELPFARSSWARADGHGVFEPSLPLGIPLAWTPTIPRDPPRSLLHAVR